MEQAFLPREVQACDQGAEATRAVTVEAYFVASGYDAYPASIRYQTEIQHHHTSSQH